MNKFDRLNEETRRYNNVGECRESWYRDSFSLSPSEKIARANNEAFRANNGCYPDRPYGPHGTYSTGKKP